MSSIAKEEEIDHRSPREIHNIQVYAARHIPGSNRRSMLCFHQRNRARLAARDYHVRADRHGPCYCNDWDAAALERYCLGIDKILITPKTYMHIMETNSFPRFLSIAIILSLIFPMLVLGIENDQTEQNALPITPETNVAGYEGTLYNGQIHNHATSYSDDATAGTIAQDMVYMSSTATPRLDFGGLTPHNHMLTSPNMLTYWSEMRAFNSPTFTALPGQEWSSLSTSNHVNILLSDERCAVANGDIPGFYSWLNNSGGYGSFNHPWDSGGSDMNNWEYYPFQDKPGNFNGKMVMMEMKQTAGDATAFADYTEALGKGWHIGIAVSDDDHLGVPGDKYANNPRTGMWLNSLNEASIETALQNLRFFGSQLQGGYIDLKAGNYTMGDIFQGTNSTVLYAMLNSSFTYSTVEIFIDGVSYPMSMIDSGHYSYTIQAGASHYYFVRARETATGAYIISSPMWSSTGGSTPPPQPPSVEAPTNVTAELNGADVIVQWDGGLLGENMSSAQAQIIPLHDAQVVEGYPTTNYGAATSLYVQSDMASLYLDERAWMRYDLSSTIPAGATITSANLQMYCWKATGSNMDTSCHSSTDDTWLETGINWNTQPAYGSALDTKTLAVGVTSVWYSWNVTSFIQSEWAGNKLASLVVRAVTEGSSPAKTYAFESSEYATTTLRPYLQVSYTTVTGSGRYEIYRGNSYDPTGTTYSYIGQVPAGTASYPDVGAGTGNSNNYFYTVRAVNLASEYAVAETQAGKFATPVQTGWNLVSVPLTLNNEYIGTVLQTVGWDNVRYYDTLDYVDHWKGYRASMPDFKDLVSADNTMGLWVNSVSAGTFITAGQVASTVEIPLYAGWNLVGYPSFTQRSITAALAGTGFDMPLEGFISTTPYIEQRLNTYLMRPGEGYWVHVPADTVWIVDW
jgi:hypothetical protein